MTERTEYLVTAKLTLSGTIIRAESAERAALLWAKETKEGQKYVTRTGTEGEISVYRLGPREVFHPDLETRLLGVKESGRG